MTTYVVIPAHRPRLNDLRECLAAFGHPHSPVEVIIVTNQPHPIPVGLFPSATVVLDNTEDLNLARWHNLGKDRAAEMGATEILYMESDVRISYVGITKLRDALRRYSLSAVGPDYWGAVRPGRVVRRYTNAWIPPTERVCQASLVPGDSPHRMDERLRWHYEADDLEFKCRLDRGTGLVGGTGATHVGTLFHDMPPEHTAASQAGLEIFREKWGKTPWDRD